MWVVHYWLRMCKKKKRSNFGGNITSKTLAVKMTRLWVRVSIKNTVCVLCVIPLMWGGMIRDCVQVFSFPVISWKSSATLERLLNSDRISINSADNLFLFTPRSPPRPQLWIFYDKEQSKHSVRSCQGSTLKYVYTFFISCNHNLTAFVSLCLKSL